MPTHSPYLSTSSQRVPEVEVHAQSTPLSAPLIPDRSASKSKTTPQPKTRRARPAGPSNRFGLRDSDTSETSTESELDECDSDDVDTPIRSGKHLSRVTVGPTRGGHSATPKRRTSQRCSVDYEPRYGSPLSPPATDPNRPQRSKEELWQQRAFLAAVRLRQRRDPIQEYEERSRREAWKLAHAKNKEEWNVISGLINSTSERASQQIAEMHRKQLAEVERALQQMSILRSKEEEKLRAEYRNEDKDLRDSIERSIAAYEAEICAAEEARQRAALLTRQAEEERTRKAKEQADNLAHQEQLRQQLLEQKLKQQEEEEAQQRAEAEQQRLEAERDNIHDASSLIIPKPAAREFQAYRELMTKIKVNVMPTLKATKLNPDFVPDPQVKRTLSQARRSVIPKIGQITNIRQVQDRVTRELGEIINPPGETRPMSITLAIQYILSKAVLKQAEVEVSAKPNTAFPLARVMIRLIETSPGLSSIFMAKLVTMTGPWVVAMIIPREPDQSDDDYRKALGYKPLADGETHSQYIEKMVGLVTLYAAMLQTPPTSVTLGQGIQANQICAGAKDEVVPGALLLPRLWTWLARLTSNAALMRQSAAPHILAAILETAGDTAMTAFKKEMVKLRIALWKKCVAPDRGNDPDPIGGAEGEGKAGRVRLALLLEQWQTKGYIGVNGTLPFDG